MCMAATTNFAGLFVARFLMGVLEAGKKTPQNDESLCINQSWHNFTLYRLFSWCVVSIV